MDLPERFRGHEEEDVDDGTGVGNEENGMFVQQSVYGMLAATQSRANFKFDQDSGSDTGDEGDDGSNRKTVTSAASNDNRLNLGSSRQPSERKPEAAASRHQKRLSETTMRRSFLQPARQRIDAQARDPMTQSQILPARNELETDMSEDPAQKLEFLRADAPILDRKLQAMARAGLNASSTSLSGKQSGEGEESRDANRAKAPKSLPHVIADIFKFDEPEDVVAEYPCWYLQNVLLQGYMYITQKHVCFYAYLKRKTNTTIKTGHLGKCGKHSYSYKQYWFVLKGDNFCYYKSSAEPYSPLGVVDLRYAISADVSQEKDSHGKDFIITTHDRTYLYRAETAASAKEWVKQLQKVIFRSHNDGDSVKISLPIQRILDAEKTEVVDFAETVKLRVYDNDEDTYAVDEYFFTFFSFGDDAWDVLSVLTGGNRAKQATPEQEDSANLLRNAQRSKSGPKISRQAGVASSGLSSLDRDQRTRIRRSGSRSPLSPSMQESSESYFTSGDEVDANMSASQMLSDDCLFGAPTLRMPQRQRTAPGPSRDRFRRGSSQRSSSGDSSVERVQAQPSAPNSAGHATRPDPQPRSSTGSGQTLDADTRQPPADTTASGRVIRGIAVPLQRAFAVAGMVRTSSSRMGSYLSSSPKDYIGRWTGAMSGGKKHYSDVEGLAPDDSVRELDQDGDIENDQSRFQAHFGLPHTERLVSTFFCWLHKTVPLYGKVYMSQRRFCFRSLLYGTRTKLVISFKDIVTVHKQRGFRWGYSGMVLVIKGHEELFFEFGQVGLRDDCAITVLRSLENDHLAAESTILDDDELELAETAAAENERLQAAMKDGRTEDEQLPRSVQQIERNLPPVHFDDPSASMLDFKPAKPMNITCLTIGSRGDVQPYIALCKGFIADGHRAKIATHKIFEEWVQDHGIEFAEIEGDPADLMRICVENGMFTPSFFLEANSKFRVWLDGLLVTSWEACKGSDLIIESPSAMSGIHIAEKLQVPYFRAFTMPWTRTRAYPHAFSVPNSKKGGAYNYMTYTLFDNVFWIAISGQINRWRGKTLGLMPTSLDRLQQNKVPFLYNFSPSVVVPPLDFSDWIKVTGYWFLDEGVGYSPPADLAAFIAKARSDKVKLVYIGFGSVTVADSKQLMQQVMDAVHKADVRCILVKGWSDRFDKSDPTAADIELPSYIYQIRAAPHDWLFNQVDAVVHHGGAGTTGASLRAGVPTIIKPFFGDQFFFATRVEDLGVGIQLSKITAHQLGKALWIATHDARMQTKARLLGEQIRAEDGVQTAINTIYRDMEYAKSLVKRTGDAVEDEIGDGKEEATEENWTFVGATGEIQAEDEIVAPEGAIAVPSRSSAILR